jgi:hypothetical protein
MFSHEPALERFREAVAGFDGDRLDRVVLFGSRARAITGPNRTSMSRSSSTTWVIFKRSFALWPI